LVSVIISAGKIDTIVNLVRIRYSLIHPQNELLALDTTWRILVFKWCIRYANPATGRFPS